MTFQNPKSTVFQIKITNKRKATRENGSKRELTRDEFVPKHKPFFLRPDLKRELQKPIAFPEQPPD